MCHVLSAMNKMFTSDSLGSRFQPSDSSRSPLFFYRYHVLVLQTAYCLEKRVLCSVIVYGTQLGARSESFCCLQVFNVALAGKVFHSIKTDSSI